MPAMVKNPHREPAAAARHGLTDAAEAVNPERLVVHVRAPQQSPLPLFPPAVANVAVPFDDATRDGQEKRKGQVGRRFLEHTGGVGHRDSTAGAPGHVDIVVAYAHVGDDPQAGRVAQDLLVQARSTDHYALHLPAGLGHLRGRKRCILRVILEIAGRGQPLEYGGWEGAGDENFGFHKCGSTLPEK